ncbi:putative selenium metabolism hydrolase [Dethiosulfatibacter aminovorans DSM 17477]|uniref:Putative selenium metabolism hydrolase n=1 Tax=Dethiosulfatibacter aminovorans DSM 17477 TaxID=1121476 RepID=A0A1M6HC23_9FIRM|nr:YgeY family selenium metabolism-linked hydrolase [Dethiosulfatibacter aminovorans]SHJ19732.1 putative selenium metabolism hydrolase [Dethiosulfatibacter aminovorans DSM 17477]
MNRLKRMDKIADEMKNDVEGFLRDLIAIKSTSTEEEEVVKRIREEMEVLDFDEIIIDRMGNILGRVGDGKNVFAYDGHIDTVDVGWEDNWEFHPFQGKEDEEYIYGRGASDQKGGFASCLYGAAIAKKAGFLDGVSLWVVGSVQEEDCDGLCWQHILEEETINPEFVVLTEPTGLNVYRGHRGRMEIKVSVKGISAHGSAPERGDNAIYKMASILKELEVLNERLKYDEFLGKGTLTVSEIFYTSPSRCAVADGCSISVDRRLTFGETKDSAIGEIKDLKSVSESGAEVEMYTYSEESYTGLVQEVDCYFPTWVVGEDSKYCAILLESCEKVLGRRPLLDKWTFSTNGVAIMGMKNIPCIGFGPGREEEAHAPNEKILKEELMNAVKVYAIIPELYKGGQQWQED